VAVVTPAAARVDPEAAPAAAPAPAANRATFLIVYFVLGIAFGITLMKAEVVSWFRIQEMFRFQAFHMYGVMFSAVLVAAASLAVIKRLGLHAADGSAIVTAPKVLNRGARYWIGGGIFGIGWALTGACPGPLFALLGGGVSIMAVAILAALAGTWTYGLLRPRLPH
jgi:uncharacterized membrane protein YedE/YeeE